MATAWPVATTRYEPTHPGWGMATGAGASELCSSISAGYSKAAAAAPPPSHRPSGAWQRGGRGRLSARGAAASGPRRSS